MPNDSNRDAEQITLLSTFHYVVAGLAALFSFFPLIYTGMGFLFIALAHHPPSHPGQSPPPVELGWFFVGLGLFFALLGFSFAILLVLAGRALGRRRRYQFVFVIACVECLFMPFGTVLGVFTLIFLSRESARKLFEGETLNASPSN